MKLASRIKSFFGGQEGSWRGPFFGQGELGGWYELGRLEDGFQRNLELDKWTMQRIPAIAGAKHLYRSAFAQLWPEHHRYADDDSVESIKNSPASRVMLTPNSYESGSEFNARLVDQWITYGSVVALASRNNRFEVDGLHIMPFGSWQLEVDPDSKEVFYLIGESADYMAPVKASMVVPARDVLHLRWATPRHPLVGESPLQAAGVAAGIHTALSRSQATFFSQMRRPSGVISTEEKLTREQMTTLRAAWDDQSKRLSAGGVPILGSGLKWQPMSITSADAEVISSLKMSNDEIFRALGVPPPLLGALEHATLANTEQLVQAWLAFSLGGLIERYERALDRLFGFNPRKDRVEMGVDSLLRSDLDGRMSALSKGIVGGVMSPNEARRKEGLSPVEGGDQIFLQRQNTPIDLLSQLAAAELTAKATPQQPPEPAPAPEPDSDDKKALTDEEAQGLAYLAITKAMQ